MNSFKVTEMKAVNDFEFENPFFRSYIQEKTAILEILTNPYEIAIDIELSYKLINLISFADNSEAIHSLLVIPALSCCDEESYHNFIKSIFIEGSADDHLPKVKDPDSLNKRTKQINLLNRFILNLIDFKKISVIALHGPIVTPFIGASLAFDFRIASSDMQFSFVHTEHGVHPSGALPFFLPKYLTPSQSKKYLFMGGKIDAEASLKLNLVDKVFEPMEFENKCIEYMNELNKLSVNFVRSTKKLMHDKEELNKYFENESGLRIA